MESEVLDVRGKACPVPLLLTKRKLEAMHAGEVLEVLSDFRQTMDNIADLAERTGNKTIKTVDEKGVFKITIRKSPEGERRQSKQADFSCTDSRK